MNKVQSWNTMLGNLQGLHFLPLGGCGEIGMNANFYHSQGKWLMVDNGITFSRVPDRVITPDIRAFMAAIGLDKLSGLVITHAHEDHVGGVAYLWPFLKCPLYATPFTAIILRKKLKDLGIKAPVIEIPLEGSFQVGPFGVQFVSLTHSIPEPNALVIKTQEGSIFHTGDWKIDPAPLIGPTIDAERLIRLGKEGILAMVCDSTNVFEEGTSGSEKEVQTNLEEIIAECSGNRIILSCFSSNLARILSCYKAAKKNKREVALVGISLQRMVEAARQCGYLDDSVQFVPLEECKAIAPARLLILTTGSQAEPRAALTRMAYGTHPVFQLAKGDTVIFSSRVIPGNQEGISALQNKLALLNVDIVTHKDGLHVSGHPCRDELKQMYAWIKPSISIPVHGEDRHIREHAEFARTLGIPQVIRPQNGQLFRLDGERVQHLFDVPTGRLIVDGLRLIPSEGRVMTERKQLLEQGLLHVVVSFCQTTRKLTGKHLMARGVFENELERTEWKEHIKKEFQETFSGPTLQKIMSKIPMLPFIEEVAERCLRKLFRQKWGLSPMILVSSTLAPLSSELSKQRPSSMS